MMDEKKPKWYLPEDKNLLDELSKMLVRSSAIPSSYLKPTPSAAANFRMARKEVLGVDPASPDGDAACMTRMAINDDGTIEVLQVSFNPTEFDEMTYVKPDVIAGRATPPGDGSEAE